MIFSTFDLIALVIQAIGGSGAAQAEQKGTSTLTSTHILVRSPDLKLMVRKRVSSFKRAETLCSQLWLYFYGIALVVIPAQ